MESGNKLAMCRLCLCENDYFSNIFDLNDRQGYIAAEVLSDLLQLKVSETDGYPHVICSNCLIKLTDFKMFKECCHESKVKYDNMFASSENLEKHKTKMPAIKHETLDIDCTSSEGSDKLLEGTYTEVTFGPSLFKSVVLSFNQHSSPQEKLFKSKDSGNVDAVEPAATSMEDSTQVLCTKEKERLEDTSRSAVGVSDPEDSEGGPEGSVSDNECSIEWTNMDIELEKHHCVGCRRVFHSEKKLKQHAESCQQSCLYSCKDCSEVLPNLDELNRHKYLFHSLDNSYPCGRCLTRFSSWKKLVKHIRMYDFKCKAKDLSELRTDNSEVVVVGQSDKSHIVYPVISTELKTLVANSTSEKGAELIKEKHGSDTTTKRNLETLVASDDCHKCATCDEICNSRKTLVQHIKVAHRSENAFICKVCKSGFTSRLNLGVHQYSHNKQFTCEICGREYLTKMCFKLHTKTCQEKSVLHKCEVCGKEMYSRGNLRVHMFQHSTEKRFACTRCTKRYKLKCDLRRHVRVVHLKLKPHECGICQKRFPTRSELKSHYPVHSDERPFNCAFCERSFKLERTLRFHEKSMHFGEMCGKRI